MVEFTSIASDSALCELVSRWESSGVIWIAMDFEGEFNLHVYGEHLCLIQIYDKLRYYIIDPFTISQAQLRRLLEHPRITKIMFDCASDAALVRKQYGIQLAKVHDVRITAQLLGYHGNLDSLREHCTGEVSQKGKKRNQMANWMARPLPRTLIEYALADVEYLFIIRETLDAEAKALGLSERDAIAQKMSALQKHPDRPGYEKLPGYRYFSKHEKIFVKHLFESREVLAKRYNLPSFRILDKKQIVEIAKQPVCDEQQLKRFVKHPNRKIEQELFRLMCDAIDNAKEEILKGDL